jgi:hypothetical protein
MTRPILRCFTCRRRPRRDPWRDCDVCRAERFACAARSMWKRRQRGRQPDLRVETPSAPPPTAAEFDALMTLLDQHSERALQTLQTVMMAMRRKV